MCQCWFKASREVPLLGINSLQPAHTVCIGVGWHQKSAWKRVERNLLVVYVHKCAALTAAQPKHHTDIYVHMENAYHTYVYVCTVTCTYICMYVGTYHVQMYIRTNIHTYVHTCIHTYTHTHTHTNVHTPWPVSPSSQHVAIVSLCSPTKSHSWSRQHNGTMTILCFLQYKYMHCETVLKLLHNRTVTERVKPVQ